jgi:hypothetical protein
MTSPLAGLSEVDLSYSPRWLRRRATSSGVSAVSAGLVQWPATDRVLTSFSAESLLALLGAAIDSPLYRDRERHLWGSIVRGALEQAVWGSGWACQATAAVQCS